MRLDSRRRRRAGAIGLTPLIDVVFILLLFFMLSTQLTDHRAIPLELPSRASTTEPTDDARLSLLLRTDGKIVIDGEVLVTVATLARHPLVRAALLSDRGVRVRGETAVSLQSLTSLMDRLAAIGLARVALGRSG